MLCRTVEYNSQSIAPAERERAALKDYKDPSEKLTYGPGEKKA